MNKKKTFPFIGVFAACMVALASASCMKEVPDMQVVSQPSDAITFGVDDSFIAEVQTKATEVTSLSSFYVTAVTGSAGSESSVWNSVRFSQVAGSSPATYAGNKYWPASNPSYKFYGSNVALNFAAGGTYVNASNATDVVCAYLSSPTYNTKNTLTFEHIFARLCRVDIVAASGYTLSDISLRITPKTDGTYNLRTKEWSSVATGSATTIASSTGANNNDIFCVPGIYSITASWVARDASGASVTHTNEVCNVPLTGGKTNNISCVLGGDITFGVDLQDYADYDYRDNLDYFTIYSPQAQTIRWKIGIAYYDSIEDFCNDYNGYDYDETVELIENNIPGKNIEYSKDSGKTWFSIDASIVGAEIPVDAGDVIRFYGDNDGYGCYGLLDGETPHIFFEFEEPTYVYGDMSSLLSDPSSMDDSAFANFFLNNDNLLSIKSKPLRLPDKTSPYSYFEMFSGCTSLTTAPKLPATTLADYCYQYMFAGCTSLTTAPELPATTLTDYCYSGMFSGCTSLTTAPELPATTLANGCYNNMLNGCTSLTAAPALPATTLANQCYGSMFQGCTSLTAAPVLPATTLANQCYANMFSGCTSLTTAPKLPATVLANSCYTYMFRGCTSLTTAPELPATTLANGCYSNMFNGCTSLTTAPELPATTLVSICYSYMFQGCSSLNYIKALFTTTPSGSYTGGWVQGVAPTGTFVKSVDATWDVVGNNGVPTGWIVETGTYDAKDNPAYLTFYCDEAGTIGWKCSNASVARTIQYSKDFGATWTDLTSTTSGATVSVSAGDIVWLKGSNTEYATSSYYNQFVFSNKVHVYGNVNSLTGNNTSVSAYCFKQLFYNCSNLYTYEHKKIILPATTLATYCYYGMFARCSSLTMAPELPATTLANYCYSNMFQSCPSLTTAPWLPATTLARNCYYCMFYGCTSLTTAPKLPATTLASSCYYGMFNGCTSLTSAPAELPATTLANFCYQNMFYGCSSLTKVPELPATTLANDCYYGMFARCSSLTMAPKLPATTLMEYCYYDMFYGCSSLTTAPKLPATTLATYCYYGMFARCSSLTMAPELPATTLANNCYYAMFDSCSSLTTAPELPATTLMEYCYSCMFRNCTSLTSAPELPATTLENSCYISMFQGCSSLNYIKALFTTTPSSSYTSDWVSGVAPTGTFVKSSAATWNVTGTYGVPTGWTVMTEYQAYLTNGHAFVDLGLRSNGNKILFATMNVGASSPEEYGYYFAWGETSKRYTSISGDSVVGGSFEWSNCPYHTGSTYNTGWSKYISTGKEFYTVSGTADNKLVLDASDDVASALWGGSWRMPTAEELCMLINGNGTSTDCDEADNVTYSWTNDYNGTGVHGYIITGKGSFSSASLFLPAAGNCGDADLSDAGDYGYYWSRSVYSDDPNYAWNLFFEDSDQRMDISSRYYGLSVRPVLVIPE